MPIVDERLDLSGMDLYGIRALTHVATHCPLGGRTATIRATRLPPSVASRGLAAGPWRAWGRPCGLGLGGAPAAVAVAAKGGVDDGVEELFEC